MGDVEGKTSPRRSSPTEFCPDLEQMNLKRAETSFPFGSLIVESFYTNVFTKPKESYPKSTQLGITLFSGYLACVICAIVSHPADSLVLQIEKKGNQESRWDRSQMRFFFFFRSD